MLPGCSLHDMQGTICYYSLYLRRVRQLVVRFYEGVFPEFDVKHVTIDTVYIFTLIEELLLRPLNLNIEFSTHTAECTSGF